MRSRGDAGSDLKAKHSNSQHGSQRSGKSLRNQELGESDYGLGNTSSNPIEYTDEERAEFIRRLDSIKDHLLRGGNAIDHNQSFLKPIHGSGPGPSYYHPFQEPFPLMYSQGYQDPYGFQIHRRPPPGHYLNQMTRPYPGGSEPRSYLPATQSDVSSPVSSHHRGEKLTAQPHVNNSLSFPSSMRSPGGSRGSYTSDLDSEMGGVLARGSTKKAVSDTDARRCHPLASGAPFIACHSCFEVLYLPKKKLLAQERQHKLQCGVCSEVNSFSIVDKKFVFSSGNEEPSSVSLEVEDRTATNTVVVEEEELASGDFNNSGSYFAPKDEEEIQELRNHRDSILSESQLSDNEERLNMSSEQQQKEVKSVHQLDKGSKSLESVAPESASLLELFEHSTVNRAALAYGMSKLGYNKSEKQVSFMKQDSVKPESVATETDVSYNGYSNTDITEDSRYSDNNRSRSRNYSKSGSSIDQNEDEIKSLEVWVNGHLIPEDLVSNAENLAGQIQAGKYWYDYRAGFWGVMGKPCVGMIPPFIEEFNHKMPEKCGGGNTEVFVNGRELHKRDFELLIGRGLPRDKNRSYIVDISGRILDEDSGEELKSLGKLAPTISKVKRGFGMRVPRSLAS